MSAAASVQGLGSADCRSTRSQPPAFGQFHTCLPECHKRIYDCGSRTVNPPTVACVIVGVGAGAKPWTTAFSPPSVKVSSLHQLAAVPEALLKRRIPSPPGTEYG